jgi:hypothetical protein
MSVNKNFGLIRKKLKRTFLKIGCHSGLSGIFHSFFVHKCLYSEGFPTRFACENDISCGRDVECNYI